MKRQTQPARTAVVCSPDESRRQAIQARLAAQGLDQLKWFAPGNLHDLDRAVLNGQIRHVVFRSLPDLLHAIWEEEIAFEEWPTADLHIDFLEPPDDEDMLRLVSQTWETWRKSHRRRQALAGTVVSFIVLALSFILCLVLNRM